MKLLVVDDIATNRELLREMFGAAGHTTLEAVDGVEALQILAHEMVDAVLTDILMPRMDGYRLCHEIRTNDRIRNLPIVIYTATYTSPSDERLALSIGADKYLKKPAPFKTILIALHEAIARQRTSLRPEAWQEVEVLKEYSDRLVTKLEETNIELTKVSERLTILDHAKSEFLDVIAHELRTPLSGLFGVSDFILEEGCSPEEHIQLKTVYKQSRRRILSILDDALLLTRIDVTAEQFGSAPVSLSMALIRAIESATEFAESRHVTFALPSADLDLVVGDEDLLVRALQALLETAVKFSEEGEVVCLAHEVVADSVRVIIESHGREISTTALPKFFEIFSIGETLTPGGDLGLAPPVAYRILSLFGASVSVANLDSSGIQLTISLRKAG
jgi:CheY-like chemotaxis protein/C4-dicarboxylate-specific signal transduction histidine kinase